MEEKLCNQEINLIGKKRSPRQYNLGKTAKDSALRMKRSIISIRKELPPCTLLTEGKGTCRKEQESYSLIADAEARSSV